MLEGDQIEIVIDRGKLTGVGAIWLAMLRASLEQRKARGGWRRESRARTSRRIRFLPDDTRLWAALVEASGGVWGGCVYDTEKIVARLECGEGVGFVVSHSCAKDAHEWGTQICGEWVEVRAFPCLKSETWGTHVRLRMKLPGEGGHVAKSNPMVAQEEMRMSFDSGGWGNQQAEFSGRDCGCECGCGVCCHDAGGCGAVSARPAGWDFSAED